ncbi:hypothetical protein B0H19DRAFT_1076020 [Mycena capillaripes]|nr:hypothetical protein B0H19DRAFT_1076020 [Mycena capillaripes]
MAPPRPFANLPEILPRITEPYSGDHGYEPFLGSFASVLSVEAARAAHNKEVCQLRKAYISEKAMDEGDSWDAMTEYYRSKSSYQEMYGKFVPDSQNAAWFAKINPRIAELLMARKSLANVEHHDHPDMVKYLAAAEAFEEEFEHPFTAHDAEDGLDEHFNRMAFHACIAKGLAGDPNKLAEVLSTPLTFTVYNPYLREEYRSEFNDEDFDRKLRDIKRELEGDAAVEALEPTVLKNFPFSLSFTDLQGYYDAKYTEEKLYWMSMHHSEELSDDKIKNLFTSLATTSLDHSVDNTAGRAGRVKRMSLERTDFGKTHRGRNCVHLRRCAGLARRSELCNRPGQGEDAIVAPRLRSVRWTSRSRRVAFIRIHPNEVHVATNVAVVALAVADVDGEAGFDVERVDPDLKVGVEDALEPVDGVQFAREVLVPGVGDMGERLLDGVPNARSEKSIEKTEERNRNLHCSQFSPASQFAGAGCTNGRPRIVAVVSNNIGQ